VGRGAHHSLAEQPVRDRALREVGLASPSCGTALNHRAVTKPAKPRRLQQALFPISD